MEFRESLQSEISGGHLAPLQEYKDTVERLFPDLERGVLDDLSLSAADALFLGEFLKQQSHGAVVLEVGTSAGGSTFCFAGLPNVSTVIGVGANPSAVDTFLVSPGGRISEASPGRLEGLGTLDVVRAGIAELAEVQNKVQLLEDGMNTGLEKASGEVEASNSEGLVILLRRSHTREEITDHLRQVLETSPNGIVFLEDCRGGSGPSVQAGVADLLEESESKYHFGLVGELSPGLAGSSLGFVCSKAVAEGHADTLYEVGRAFSGRLDPLRLLQREEELVETVSRVDQELRQTRQESNRLQSRISELERELRGTRKSKNHHQSRVSDLQRHNAQLKAHYSSRRYKIVDGILGRMPGIPALRRLLRR